MRPGPSAGADTPGACANMSAAMKRAFYSGLAGIAIFEILKVYFIMPMPGSQRMESLDAAYLLHTYRWLFRGALLVAIVLGTRDAFRIKHKWLPAAAVLGSLTIVWFLNFRMSADSIFTQPRIVTFKPRAESTVDESSLVIGVEHQGEAKAYPIRFLVFHHQVQDSVGGQPVIVTYCSVCRTGRVFEPVVNGRPEQFRLVGMDHWNAMFEDATTHSWWRQATGEAVAGPRKGTTLPEADSRQVTLRKWFELHPAAMVMQIDEASREHYDPQGRYERGESTGALTRTDRASWADKSWVVGVQIGGASKAYDWNRLAEARVINDAIGAHPVVLALALDRQSFAAFERPDPTTEFTIDGDVLSAGGRSYDFNGRELDAPSRRLEPVPAHQEFWHSWRTFHPATQADR
jgi:Protein of unknown function (DUF3179)